MNLRKIVALVFSGMLLLSMAASGGGNPYICTGLDDLFFGFIEGYLNPSFQIININNAGSGVMKWMASTNKSWLTATPGFGTNAGQVKVTVDPTGLTPGTYNGGVTFSAPGADNDPRTVNVTVNVYSPGTASPPFGSFDTPMNDANVSGSIPVTGWALDDTGVESVKIYRPGSEGNVYIGDASFIEGARWDIYHSHLNYPYNYQAGWGYMLLTNFLPGGGNGTYSITAIATDKTGNKTTLGTKTIICDNANAVKPFGAIDTPAQGGTASGSSYINWGWALTPQPNHIPADGSTISVLIDGEHAGNPTYNLYRQDIAGLFPDYANSQGAVGYFEFDTTPYYNGVHTIEWIVTDNVGNTDGIGSRYFRIQNNENSTLKINNDNINTASTSTNPTTQTQTFQITNSGYGTLSWDITNDSDWLVCTPTYGSNTVGQKTTVTVTVDPLGLTEGTHQETLTITDPNASLSPQTVTVNHHVVSPSQDHPPFGSFDTPVHNSTVRSSIPVTGWALDDTEVDHVKIYWKESGGTESPNYLGDAVFVEGARPDIQQAYPDYPNNTKTGWGYMMLTNFLPNSGNGTYTLEAIATDKSGQSTSLGTKTIICDNENAVKPFGAIDSPTWGQSVSGNTHRVSGWVLTPQPNKIPEDGSTIGVYVDGNKVGNATYNQYRADISQIYPKYANADGAGAFFDVDLTGYADGVHTIYWTATDNDGNTDGIGSRYFTIRDPDDHSSQISINRTQQTFGAIQDGPRPATQSILINNSGDGQLNWSITNDADWLVVTPSSGSGPGVLTVEANQTGLGTGTYHGTLTVSSQNAGNSPQTVNVQLDVYSPGTTMPPFGDFAIPQDGSMQSGSIPVTGWVLDDVGVDKVGIYVDGSSGVTHVGDALLVEGARPDIAQAFPNYPNNNSAGWEFTLNTNTLPDGSDGTYSVMAKAYDVEGNANLLGTKTIYCDNANAVKPFGAIDTPAPGGTASGSSYYNWGWALTPQPNMVPKDGSTIEVFIDGNKAGNATYNVYRQDIADQFPEYHNAWGAGACFEFDTTPYSNGVHTIYWQVTDNDGNTDGIGSRFFNIFNPQNAYLEVNKNKLIYGATDGVVTPSQTITVSNSGTGTLSWHASANQDWLTCYPTSGVNAGSVVVTVNSTGLHPDTYKGTVRIEDPNAYNSPQNIEVVIVIKHDPSIPFGEFNNPQTGKTVSGSIPVTGWVLDDVGVQSVKVYRKGSEIYIGDATLVEGARPDIAQVYSSYPRNDMAGWSYSLLTNLLPDEGNGEYDIYAKAIDLEGNEITLDTTTIIADNINAVNPFGDMDTPESGGTASGTEYTNQGWVLTPPPNTIPVDGSTIEVFIDGLKVGTATYNNYREDIATQFPGYNNSDGAMVSFVFDTTPYENGIHTISWKVEDDAGNITEGLASRQFTIQNPPIPATGVEDGKTTMLPAKTNLDLSYPNPFNPQTRISYSLSKSSRVNLIIFDIRGRRVRQLMNNIDQSPGYYNLTWHGVDDGGHSVSTGIYFLVMKTGSFVKTRKLILLR